MKDTKYYVEVEVETNWWIVYKDNLTLEQARNNISYLQTVRHKNFRVMHRDKDGYISLVENAYYGGTSKGNGRVSLLSRSSRSNGTSFIR
jgi:hypothetical protein